MGRRRHGGDDEHHHRAQLTAGAVTDFAYTTTADMVMVIDAATLSIAACGIWRGLRA